MATIVYLKFRSHQRASPQPTVSTSRPVSSSLALPSSYPSSQVSILACSADPNNTPTTVPTTDFERTFYLYNGRVLGEDRKGPFDHLYPKRFVINTVRVVMTQASKVFSQYMADQLNQEIRRDEQVSDHLITREQAEKESEEWSTREWDKRWKDFRQHKLWQSLAEWHAVMLVMRFYEYLASKWVDTQTLDRLTYDASKASKRANEQGIEGRELGREMVQVCWRANLISFLADYTVQQAILLAAYYAYVRRQRQRLQEKRDREGDHGDEDDNSSVEEMAGPLVELILKKSTKLAITQGVCLGCASIGGAFGAMVRPTWGWATVIGTNLGGSVGDQVASVFVDDGTRPSF